jgi:methyltransferase-like protein
LQYLGDSLFSTMAVCVPPHIRATLERLSPDPLEREQYLDFLACRMFRRTLLCHDHVKLTAAPCPEAVETMKALALVAPVSPDMDVRSNAPATFRKGDGSTVSIDQPLLKAALIVMHEHWPQAVPFAELRSAVRLRLARPTPSDPTAIERDLERLGETLIQGFASALLELHVHVAPYVREVSEYPVACPLARHQAQSGSQVVNLRHQTVVLSRLDHHVIDLLDGLHDRAALAEMVAGLVADGTLEIRGQPNLSRASAQIQAIVTDSLDRCLHRLAANALLVE